jgi:hypothetical protein
LRLEGYSTQSPSRLRVSTKPPARRTQMTLCFGAGASGNFGIMLLTKRTLLWEDGRRVQNEGDMSNRLVCEIALLIPCFACCHSCFGGYSSLLECENGAKV